MTQSPNANDETHPPRSAALLLSVTILDTTWRTFGPTIGGTFAGIGLDNLFHTAPWWTVAMVSLGFVISMGLVVQQIIGVKKK